MNGNIEVITENLWAVNFSFVKMNFIKELSFNNPSYMETLHQRVKT